MQACPASISGTRNETPGDTEARTLLWRILLVLGGAYSLGLFRRVAVIRLATTEGVFHPLWHRSVSGAVSWSTPLTRKRGPHMAYRPPPLGAGNAQFVEDGSAMWSSSRMGTQQGRQRGYMPTG